MERNVTSLIEFLYVFKCPRKHFKILWVYFHWFYWISELPTHVNINKQKKQRQCSEADMETQRCPAGSFATVMHNKVFVEGTYFPMEVVAQTLHKYELVNLFFSIPHKWFLQNAVDSRHDTTPQGNVFKNQSRSDNHLAKPVVFGFLDYFRSFFSMLW